MLIHHSTWISLLLFLRVSFDKFSDVINREGVVTMVLKKAILRFESVCLLEIWL